MPSVSQLVTWAKLNAPGWNTDGEKGILPIMNEAYNILRRVPAEQNVMVSGGELPNLPTKQGTFNYDLPKNIWRVDKVGFSMPYYSEYDLIYLNEWTMKRQRQVPDEFFFFAGRKYLAFKHLRTFDKTFNRPAHIEFTVDPGDTPAGSDPGGLFLYHGYEEPTPQLTSINIEVNLPESLHYYLLEATQKLIEAFTYGNYVEAYRYIDKELKPEVNERLNQGEQGLSGHVQRREF